MAATCGQYLLLLSDRVLYFYFPLLTSAHLRPPAIRHHQAKNVLFPPICAISLVTAILIVASSFKIFTVLHLLRQRSIFHQFATAGCGRGTLQFQMSVRIMLPPDPPCMYYLVDCIVHADRPVDNMIGYDSQTLLPTRLY